MPVAKNGLKICARCQVEKPATTEHFARAAQRSDGLKPYCKECIRLPDEQRKRGRSQYKMVDGISYKTCTTCREWKPADTEHFSRWHAGLSASCKECYRRATGAKRRSNQNDPVEIDGVLSKPCLKCGVWKPADHENYAPFKEGKGGMHPWCRDCLREHQRDWREKTGSRIRKRNWLPEGSPPRSLSAPSESIAEILRRFSPPETDAATYKAYLITNRITGEHYVGITERNVADRWRQHLQSAVSGKHGSQLHACMQYFGIEQFEFRYIACAPTRYQMSLLEKQLVAQYDSVDHGYNQTRGGKSGEAKGTSVSVGGRRFISVGSAARFHRISEALVWQRIRVNGWSLEQALELAPPPLRLPRSGNEVSCGELTFPSINAAAAHFGLAESAVRSRLKNGWTNAQALGLEAPPKRVGHNKKAITIAGVDYSTIESAANAYSIAPPLLRGRLTNGWTPDEAAGLEKRRRHAWKSRPIEVNGIAYPSVTDACKSLGQNQAKIAERLRLGWTVEQAFDLMPPPPPSGEKNGQSVVVQGTTYSSKAKAARAHGVDPRQLFKRLQLGWSLEEALGIAKRKRGRTLNESGP